MVALALAGLLMLSVSQIVSYINNASVQSKSTATLNFLKSQAISIQKDLPSWLEKLRLSNSLLANCIPSGSVTLFSCPPGGVNDPQITALFSGQIITSVALVDFFQKPLTGTETSPLYLDISGSPCMTTSCQKFSLVGYMARENTSGNPGSIEFAYKIVTFKTQVNEVPTKEVIVRIPVGKNWTDMSGQCPPAGFPKRTLMTGIDSNRIPICIEPPPIPLSCPPNHILAPNGSGGLMCALIPLPKIVCTVRSSDLSGLGFPGATCQAGEVLTGGGFKAHNPNVASETFSNCIKTYKTPTAVTSETIGWPDSMEPIGNQLWVNFWRGQVEPKADGVGNTVHEYDTCGISYAICCKISH